MDAFYLFNIGQNYEAYKSFGAFEVEEEGKRGFRFTVWAPHALEVSVVGDFNQWSSFGFSLQKNEQTGVWTGFSSEFEVWQRYKYQILGADGSLMLRTDPFGRHQETRPGTASILYPDTSFEWTDAEFMRARPHARAPQPLNIYELHFGSWRRYPDGNPYNFRELAEQLGEYLVQMGYNAVEFLPLTEYPLDDSWGYQVTGYFSVTSRYGTPDEFKYLVNHLHSLGIRVLLDWVPAHFPKDRFGLARFDGSAQYEYENPLLGEREEWGTLVFDYGKQEVKSFLLSSAWYWLNEFHIDGLRVDAVSSMLYLNYGRSEQSLRNAEGGLTNLEAIEFLRHLNSLVELYKPETLMVAEEATSFPYVTKRVEEGGLGFTHKWNMGWMHDSLDYFSRDYIYRPYHHNEMTFSMTYAFSEQYVLALSHDEVVHGKKSLLDKMPGDIWRKFASLRSLLMYQMAHPGAKLTFMGYEIGQFIEWRFKEELEWFLCVYPYHRELPHFVSQLGKLYLGETCFWEEDRSWEGFSWVKVDDKENSVFAFTRRDRKGREVLVVLNLTPKPHPYYTLHFNRPGRYRLLLDSDAREFGGSQYLDAERRLFDTRAEVVETPASVALSKGLASDFGRASLGGEKEELQLTANLMPKASVEEKTASETPSLLERLKASLMGSVKAKSTEPLEKISQPDLQASEDDASVYEGRTETQMLVSSYALDLCLPPLAGLYLLREDIE